MFFIITLLSINKYSHLSPLRYIKDTGSLECMLGYMDKLINNGITLKEYHKCMGQDNNFTETYDNIINKISNKDMKLNEPILDNFTQYFNLKRSIISILPENFSFFENNQMLFKSMRPIIADLGPDLCQVLSLDFKTIINLYDYILINEENDGIEFGKLINILGVSSEWVPKVAKILSFFDPSNETLSVLMEGANVKIEYNNFINIVKNLKIPTDDQTKFFSFVKFVDAFSAAVDIIEGVLHNFILKYINEFFVPLIKTYIIKPINIFDKSIYERAVALGKALIKLQDYALSCDKDPDQMTDSDANKCMSFKTIINLISGFMPVLLSEDGEYSENVTQIDIELLKEKTEVFTNPEINLTGILIENFTVSEKYVKFFFGAVSNLTDMNKNYVDILEGSHLILNETTNETEYKRRNYDYGDGEENDEDYKSDMQATIIKYITNLTDIIKFIENLDDTSNFKLLFDYLGLSEYWEIFNFIMEQVERDNTICDNFLMDKIMGNDNETCEQMVKSVKSLSQMFTTTKKLISLMNEPTKLILDCLVPLFQELDLRISLLFNLLHKVVLAPILRNMAGINFPKSADYTNMIQSSGGLLTKLFSLLDDIIPTLIKKLPFIGDFITKFTSKIVEFLSLIRDNVDLATFFEFFMGGSSVITKMLTNVANAYDKNPDISGQDFAKAIQPTSFLNVYETAYQIDKIDEMRFKNLASAITFDGSSNNAELLNGSSAKLLDSKSFTFNDFLPFKSLVQNSKDLSNGLKNNKLNINVVAKSIGTGETNVKQSLSSLVETALSPPANAIVETSVGSGYDIDWVMAYLNGIGEFSSKVANGEAVKTKTNEYIKVKKSKKFPIGAIIGIVVGGVVVVGVAIFLGVYFGVIRKRKQNDDKNEDTSPAGGKENNENGESI